MTPAARVQAAIDVLSELEKTSQAADQFLRQWFRTRRFAGSKDRAAIGERVFTVLRHRGSFGWRMQSDAPRALVIASLLAEGADVAALFTGGGYGPQPLSEAEKEKAAHAPEADPPLSAALEFPAFLEGALQRAFGAGLKDEMLALQGRAPVDLRVNALNAKRDDVLAALNASGFAAAPTPYAPYGLRIATGEGLAALGRSALFEQGAFEFQDEAAQIASLLCGASAGSRVLDIAAGAGGKSLALAAMMKNQGEIVAFDIDASRLARLDARRARAGASAIRSVTKLEDAGDAFDIVLVDAPCSGSGTWRRKPESKWRLTPERLATYGKAQQSLLEQAAMRVRPGGRLVYATCSILPSENEDRVGEFLSGRPDFKSLFARDAWNETGLPLPPGMDEVFSASPFKTGTDGFFAALLVRG